MEPGIQLQGEDNRNSAQFVATWQDVDWSDNWCIAVARTSSAVKLVTFPANLLNQWGRFNIPDYIFLLELEKCKQLKVGTHVVRKYIRSILAFGFQNASPLEYGHGDHFECALPRALVDRSTKVCDIKHSLLSVLHHYSSRVDMTMNFYRFVDHK